MSLRPYTVEEKIAHEMLNRADAAKANTYPETNNGYAVTVLTKDGNIYEGVSYESETQTLTMHCEMTALANAAIHGEKDVVAITGPNCHMCKQLIWESALHSGIDIAIVMREGDKISQIPISGIMPFPWPEAK